MKDKQSYNILALRGVPMDDMEYVEEFDLDDTVAYTPQINEVMLNRVYDENVEYYKSKGDSEAKAIDKARKNRREAKKNIDSLITKMKKRH